MTNDIDSNQRDIKQLSRQELEIHATMLYKILGSITDYQCPINRFLDWLGLSKLRCKYIRIPPEVQQHFT